MISRHHLLICTPFHPFKRKYSALSHCLLAMGDTPSPLVVLEEGRVSSAIGTTHCKEVACSTASSPGVGRQCGVGHCPFANVSQCVVLRQGLNVVPYRTPGSLQ